MTRVAQRSPSYVAGHEAEAYLTLPFWSVATLMPAFWPISETVRPT